MKWPVYVTSLGIWLTGAVWLLFHYFVVQQTAFGPTHHPAEHWSLVAHGAFAFAGLWLMGFLWGTHVTRRWRLKRHRKSGGSLFAVMSALIASGYLLYYISGDDSREVISLTHWIIGLGMPAIFLIHWSVRRR